MTSSLHKACTQELRTLSLLGVPWAPVASHVITPNADSIGEPAVDPPAPTQTRTRSAPQQSIETKPHTDAARTPMSQPTSQPAPADKRAALSELHTKYEQHSTVAAAMPGWTNIVFADGDPNAQLMFIGEAPGADEDQQGIPFVGRAGQKLNEMIAAMGLTRESVYITNVVKVRPPENRTPTPEECQQDGPYLHEQIRIIRPKVIVTLGRPATHFLLNSTAPIGQLRGTWHHFEGIPVMPTYHPAYLLRVYTPDNRKKVWSDLKQALTRINPNG